MYHYKAILIRVIDGDTVEMDIDLGFHVFTNQNVRLSNIDTAELHSSVQIIRDVAHAAKDRLAQLCEGKTVEVRTYKADKYGRWLVDIIDPTDSTRTLNQVLVNEGLAKTYTGEGPKPVW